ncbi:MAG: ECF transporter S component, partial [Lachnospiraceae bacterium]|nr:ECF transporter S component [Lachnospiraceae bacterium]
MKYFLTIWKRSIAEWKEVRALSCCGIVAALSIALKFTASIDIGEYIRIGFSDLPGVAVSVLFGPAVGGFFWGVLDILKYIVAPTGPFFPGFTVSAVMNGILFGMVC